MYAQKPDDQILDWAWAEKAQIVLGLDRSEIWISMTR